MKKIKIGIPRGLYYYMYFPFWCTFFKSLGMEIVLSPTTNKGILNDGVRYSVDDICISVKAYHGHVKYLLNKDVDYVFVPRIVSEEKHKYNCPKLTALPDLIKSAFPEDKDKILTLNLGPFQREEYRFAFYTLGKKFAVKESLVKEAYKKAEKIQRTAERYLHSGFNTLQVYEKIDDPSSLLKNEKNKNNMLVGVVGFPYDVYDTFLSSSLLKRLNDMGIDVLVSNMLDYNGLPKYRDFAPRDLFWYQGNYVLRAGLYFLSSTSIDGVISMSSFGCGLSSIYTKMMDIYNNTHHRKPLLHLVIDEQTGEAGVVTRLEAFTDLAKLKKEGEL